MHEQADWEIDNVPLPVKFVDTCT